MTTEVWVKRTARKAARAVGSVALIYLLAKLIIAQIIYFTERTVDYSEELTHLPKCPRVKLFLDFSPTPKFNLRETKLLFPVLGFGFLGQLRGLRESILLSIKLNRTLILPAAISDRWGDFGTSELVPKRVRSLPGIVNLKQLSGLLSILPSLESGECEKFDGAFSQKMNFCKGNRLERLLNLGSLLQLPQSGLCIDESSPELELYPKNISANFDISSFGEDFEENFFPPAEASCVAVIFPNLNLDLRNLRNASFDSLIKEVIFETQVPHFIVEIAAAFAGGAFLAIDWQFGDEEWNQVRCSNLHSAEMKLVEWCKSLRLFRKEENLHPIAEQFLAGSSSIAETVFLYQSDENASSADIEQYLTSKGLRVLTRSSLRSFLASSFPECESLLDEIRISQIELQLAISAEVLFTTSNSLWSRTGELDRHVRNRRTVSNQQIIENLDFL